MSGFISWDKAALETPKKQQQGIVIGKDGTTIAPETDTVDIPAERITGDVDKTVSDMSGELPGVEDFPMPEYRDSRELPMSHGGSRSDDSDDVDMTPPRRPGNGSVPSMTDVAKQQQGSKKKTSGSLSGKKKVQDEKKSSKKADAEKQTGTSQIRDFPRVLLAIARAEFPDASNNTDALAAYVLAKSGRANLDVPESVAELVKNWEGDKTLENMERRLSALTTQNAVLLGLMQEMELIMTFIAFDRLGYRQSVASDIRNVDFLENGVTDLLERLREQTKALRKQEAIKNGRPIR